MNMKRRPSQKDLIALDKKLNADPLTIIWFNSTTKDRIRTVSNLHSVHSLLCTLVDAPDCATWDFYRNLDHAEMQTPKLDAITDAMRSKQVGMFKELHFFNNKNEVTQ